MTIRNVLHMARIDTRTRGADGYMWQGGSHVEWMDGDTWRTGYTWCVWLYVAWRYVRGADEYTWRVGRQVVGRHVSCGDTRGVKVYT